ncbi:hypothetical protein [Nostoc sp.]|uniref:hypothetical protein n=1 Tax=Nostoc sp. TaxID=1180 RepID=UPI002FF7E8F3
MLLFLRETWELFWWAMFCPSRLQQRMNEWFPKEGKDGRRPDTSFSDILFFGNSRFLTQYLLLLFIFHIPLILKLIERNQSLNWLQLPCVILIAYTTGVLFLPLGLVIPLLWLIVVLNQPDSWLKGLIEVIKILPPLPQIGIGLAVFGVSISLTVWLIFQLLKKEHLSLARNVMMVGGTISVMLGAWLATQNWLFLLLVSGMTSIFLFITRENIKNSNDAGVVAVVVAVVVAGVVTVGVAVGVAGVVAVGVAGVVAVGVAEVVAVGVAVVMAGVAVVGVAVVMAGVVAVGVAEVVAVGVAEVVAVGVAEVVAVGVAGVVAVGVAGVVAGVATLPLIWFSVVASLIAFALAPAKDNRVFIITTVILIALSVQNLGWLSALIIPVTLVSYYRIFPDYYFSSLISYYIFPHDLLKLFRFRDSTIRRLRTQTAKILFQLPPYTSELLWIPLPNYVQLLVSEFRERPQQALPIFQYTQTFSLPGFQITLQNALPQIVADQLKQIQSIPELIFTANSDHPILPFLISPFYHLDSDSDTPTPKTPLPKVKPELSILLPRLQTIIQDIQSALENKNVHLRERGLENINNKLIQLQLQLPSLGLKDEAIKRWTPVLKHWQRVIELEQNEQRKLSQGELINPFQYGNPVRLDQKDLFKGRQRFANEIVRRVLDRDRPTLVLHGPRRCGKTSFLYNFPRLLPSDILPVFVDMQSSAITTNESDFCFGLIRAIHKDCKSQGVKLPNIPKRLDFQPSPYTTLEDWFDEAFAQIGERRILLNLDEFEKIGTAIKNGQITLRLFDELRHLIQHYEQLGFLFSGVQTLEELGPNWSSYFISVVPIEMLYLEPNEAEELLLNPDPDFTLRYAPGIVGEVLMLTNCHPYCLQLLGASMVNQANFNHTDFITAELLQASINDAFISGQPYFTNIWTEFTGTTPEEIVIGQELLLQFAKTDILLPRTTEIAKKVLTRLLRYHILQNINGGYDFEIPLLKQWVRERAVIS